jgi:hypothetical protein
MNALSMAMTGRSSHIDQGLGVIAFNDLHTHAEVIAKWHEAGHANGWL